MIVPPNVPKANGSAVTWKRDLSLKRLSEAIPKLVLHTVAGECQWPGAEWSAWPRSSDRRGVSYQLQPIPTGTLPPDAVASMINMIIAAKDLSNPDGTWHAGAVGSSYTSRS